MRTLNVVGLAESGAHLLCEDTETGEQFAVPGEQLRSAAGAYRERQREQHSQQVRPGGTQEVAVPTPLSPREIQTRIRLGESLDEVAAAAGCDPARIEKYAYPVLMERSVMAERARAADVIVGGAPIKESIERVATRTLTARGQAADLRWDAHRAEDGGWLLVLGWSAGHSENLARFRYHPAASGSAVGTVAALDDAAADLVEPAPQPLRTVVEEAVAEPAAPRNPLLLPELPVATPAPAAPQPTLPGTGAEAADNPAPRRNKVAAALAHHAVPTPSADSSCAGDPCCAPRSSGDRQAGDAVLGGRAARGALVR